MVIAEPAGKEIYTHTHTHTVNTPHAHTIHTANAHHRRINPSESASARARSTIPQTSPTRAPRAPPPPRDARTFAHRTHHASHARTFRRFSDITVILSHDDARTLSCRRRKMGASSSMMRGKENVSEIVVIHHARRFGFAHVCARRGASRIAHRARGVCDAYRRRRCVVRGPPTCVRERIVVWRRRPRARTGDANYLRDAPQGGPGHPPIDVDVDVHRHRCRSIDVHRWTTDASNGRTVERSNAREGCVCLCVCLCV